MRKVLVVFKNNVSETPLVKSAVFLKERYGFEIEPIYIKTPKKNMVPMSGIVININSSLLADERENLENKELIQLEKKLKLEGIFTPLKIEYGITWEIIKERLKECDILMIEKGSFFSEETIEILKNQFKPMILIGDHPLRSLKNIGISNDDGVKVSKSVYNFYNLFSDVEKFKSFTLNYEFDGNRVVNYLRDKEKKVEEIIYKKDEDKDEYLKNIDRLDLLIMGNLSRGYLFSKIIGKKGVEIMEESKVTLFIG